MASRFDLLLGKWIEQKSKTTKRRRFSTEEKIKDEIKSWLESQGCYMRVIKSDGRKLSNGKWIPSKQGRGISDLIGVAPDGKFIAVEVKAPGREKRATPEQIEFIEQIKRRNGIAFIASSLDTVRMEYLKHYLESDS